MAPSTSYSSIKRARDSITPLPKLDRAARLANRNKTAKAPTPKVAKTSTTPPIASTSFEAVPAPAGQRRKRSRDEDEEAVLVDDREEPPMKVLRRSTRTTGSSSAPTNNPQPSTATSKVVAFPTKRRVQSTKVRFLFIHLPALITSCAKLSSRLS